MPKQSPARRRIVVSSLHHLGWLLLPAVAIGIVMLATQPANAQLPDAPIAQIEIESGQADPVISVTSMGQEPSKVVLIALDDRPGVTGPIQISGSPLLQRGDTWTADPAMLRDREDPEVLARSVVVASFSARTLYELEIRDLGFDDVAADLMLETMFFGCYRDPDDYRTWEGAFRTGIEFAGITQAKIYGAPIHVRSGAAASILFLPWAEFGF